MNTVEEVLEVRNQRGIISLESNGWDAISRDGMHMITFHDGDCKFYKEERSWAKRVVGLLKRGR